VHELNFFTIVDINALLLIKLVLIRFDFGLFSMKKFN